jgi:hypothetical protein
MLSICRKVFFVQVWFLAALGFLPFLSQWRLLRWSLYLRINDFLFSLVIWWDNWWLNRQNIFNHVSMRRLMLLRGFRPYNDHIRERIHLGCSNWRYSLHLSFDLINASFKGLSCAFRCFRLLLVCIWGGKRGFWIIALSLKHITRRVIWFALCIR